MPSGGQNKKTVAEKLLSNTYQASRDTEVISLGNAVQRVSDVSIPESLSDEGKMRFVTMVNELINCGLLHEADLHLLTSLAIEVDQNVQLEKRIAELFSLKTLSTKQIGEYTMLKRTSRQQIELIRKLSIDFGFNPAARRQLMLAPKEAVIDITDNLIDVH